MPSTALCAVMLGAVGAALPEIHASAAQDPNSRPAAIVEMVTFESAGVRVFDYLSPGHRIELPGDATLILGYLGSCIREVTQGGTITVGIEESVVESGQVDREIVECDGGRARLSAAEASQSGVTAFRAGDLSATGTRNNPVHVYSLSPAFSFPNAVDRLSIHRLDEWEPSLTLPVKGRTIDLREKGKTLTPGGTYEARSGLVVRVFKIVDSALNTAPLVGRVVRF